MFKPEERDIFPYYDGNAEGKVVYGDPMRLHRRLCVELGGNPAKWIDDYNSKDPAVSLPATERLISAVQAAFEMVVYDKKTGKGAMDKDVIDALAAYLDFQESKKKSLERTPKSPQRIPEPSPSIVTSKSIENTKSSMGSGSMPQELGSRSPLASLRESTAPLAKGG